MQTATYSFLVPCASADTHRVGTHPVDLGDVRSGEADAAKNNSQQVRQIKFGIHLVVAGISEFLSVQSV
jgi:hypothetical protein